MAPGTTGGSVDPTTIRLRLTPAAREALAGALAGRTDGFGVRLWVERGMRPHAQMMLDRPSVRDVPVTVDGVPMLVDEASIAFLRDAEVRYRSDVQPAGFEVVGPFLPSRLAAPEGAAPSPGPSSAPSDGPHAAAEGKVREALRNVYDPEIPMNVVDLGLIYGLAWGDDGALTVRMTMTSPGCPAVEELVREVEKTAQGASGAPSVKVEIVWEPPWGPEKMTDFARRQFGYA
ncbi:MAG TPA: iron-sulfur cluster assembly protein [Thermoplasmata archaeon]|nr:iron-sulfur cluster assembly protein [Thermoplasmata archaeon]